MLWNGDTKGHTVAPIRTASGSASNSSLMSGTDTDMVDNRLLGLEIRWIWTYDP